MATVMETLQWLCAELTHWWSVARPYQGGQGFRIGPGREVDSHRGCVSTRVVPSRWCDAYQAESVVQLVDCPTFVGYVRSHDM
jgi:hypothetical protein